MALLQEEFDRLGMYAPSFGEVFSLPVLIA